MTEHRYINMVTATQAAIYANRVWGEVPREWLAAFISAYETEMMAQSVGRAFLPPLPNKQPYGDGGNT